MGCSESKIEPLENKPIEIESRPKSAKSHTAPTQKCDRIVEDCIVIWLLNNSSIEIEIEKTKLCHVVSTVKLFTNSNECVNYITKTSIEKIFLIIPAMESFVDTIQNLPQIEKIYILNSIVHDLENNKDLIPILNNFHDIDSLCKQLEIDVELCELDLLVITTSPPPSQNETISENTKKQEAMFLYGQLKREILYRLKFENNAKNEFINFCRLYYTNNIEQSHMINDFETNYRPQKALYWLTRQCFIWRVLQRIQRTCEIDILYKLGFLIKHAHTQLTIFQENDSSISENVLVVYRGKTMFNDKFNVLLKDNSSGLISFGNFFVAHTDKKVATDFVHHRLNAFPHAVGIIFEIRVNPTVHSTRSPFAPLDIVHGDDHNEKHGILFGMSTVFHIDSIEEFIDESETTMWNIKLTLIADDDQQLLRLVAPLRSSEVHANPISYMGKLLMEMGEYTQAEQFFHGMLQDSSVRSQPRRLVRVHNGLGANYMYKGDYAKALEQYQEALNVSLGYLSPTHTDLAPLYDSIGKSYYHLTEYQKAVECYERAADLIALNAPSNNDQIVNDLNIRIDSARKLLNQNKE